ncbi:MAG: ATP-binding protein, partial [Candidatus Methanofastidiosa archaeon]|nr:ATP-binding protein [Candidatus Methanofastidiosa archaeon]
KVLFLDEPTEGLDVQSRRMVIETIYRLNDMGSTIFLTTHNIEEANRICERVCIINRGKIVAIDNPEKLKGAFDKSRSIEVAFDVDVKNGFFDSDLISKVMPCGDKTRVYTDEPDRVLKFIVEKAGEQGLKILSLSTCGPSLEEAFVRLTGEG